MEIKIEEGVALTPEQVNELTVKIKQAEDFQAKYEQSEREKAGIVEELKTERQKKQEAADIAKKAMETAIDDPVAKTRNIVEDILKEEKSKQIEMTRNKFEENFKSSRPEFNVANDPSGLKWNAFKATLAKLNTTSVSTQEELEDIYDDAMHLLNKNKREQRETNINTNSFAPGSTSKLGGEQPDELLPREKKLIESVGMTKEKYLKLKASQPNYISELLKQVRD